jgi:hypothetical protein
VSSRDKLPVRAGLHFHCRASEPKTKLGEAADHWDEPRDPTPTAKTHQFVRASGFLPQDDR